MLFPVSQVMVPGVVDGGGGDCRAWDTRVDCGECESRAARGLR